MNYPKSLFEGRGGFVWLWQSDGDPATCCNILRFEGRGSWYQVFETGCWQNMCKVKEGSSSWVHILTNSYLGFGFRRP